METATLTGTTQFLSFNLAEEVFAIDITKVREVLDFTSVTKVPQTPDFMRGVINLRGSVVPVVDMRLKFGMSMTEQTVSTCIIIVEVVLEDETVVIGALADSVREVFDLDNDQIEPAPKIGTHLNTEFLKGMGKKDEEFILILDINKVFTAEDLEVVKAGTGMQMEEEVEEAEEAAEEAEEEAEKK
jgi:purine-binding chemotaxis protein CheW